MNSEDGLDDVGKRLWTEGDNVNGLVTIFETLDYLTSQSTCFTWQLDNRISIDGKRIYTCTITECDEIGIEAYGETRAAAITNALNVYYMQRDR